MRLVLATLLALVGGLLAPAALLAWDAQKVLLDTDRWVEVTSPVVEDPAARTALATVVVDQASAQLACSGGIAGRLAAGRLGAGARAGAVEKVEALLATARGRETWHGANRAAHEQFVRAARSDTMELDDRLLDAGKLLELAAATVVVLARADDLLGGEDDESGSCGGSALEVLDGDGLRAAGLLARALEVASWLPAALAGASFALLLLALLVARRRMLALATWAACGSAFAAAAYVLRDELVVRLVDDIGSAPTRDLATIVVDRALEEPAANVLALAVALGVLFLAALVGTSWRRSRGDRGRTISGR